MTEVEFYKLFLPALNKALENDHINYGFYVAGPEDYVETEYLMDVENHMDTTSENVDFLDMVAYYFDAKSHNFPDVGEETINQYKIRLIEKANEIKKKYKL